MVHYWPISLFLILFLVGCGGTPEATTEVTEAELELGELQKDGEFTYGEPYVEWVTVLNCDNPLPRRDLLRESRGVEKRVEWAVEGEVGGFAGIGAGVEGKIATGYQLEVSEQIERSREIELPVQAFSSVEYPIRWQTLVWSGRLPFKLASAEGRISYLYTRHLFGEVVSGFRDRTLEDCGPIPTATTGPVVEQAAQAAGDGGAVIAATQPTSAPAQSTVALPQAPPEPTQPPPVASAQTLSRFEVQSTVMKNRTGLAVATGDIIHVEYLDGEWTGDSASPGRTNGCGFRWDDPDPNRVWLFPPEQRGAALVGYIDGTPFFVGCQPVDIAAPTSGELYLGMSECQNCYWDNDGSLFVLVSVRKP
ncbi:MAG: hypothetical protein K1X50_12970 [Candidatus Promineofilum sp.]|nr:hypothetical protein [Promineifilum sp.]